jgi:hypothetical protein
MGIVVPVSSAQVAQQILLVGADHPMYITYGVSPPGGKTATQMANDLRGYFLANVWSASARGTIWSLGKTSVQFRSGINTIELGENLTVTAGTVSDTSAPPIGGAVLVRKVTGLGGRRNRGRMYVPPFFLNESNVDYLGNIDGATLSVVQNWFNAWYNAMVAATYVPQILHSDGAVGTNVTSFSVQQKLGTQRLRMRN